MLDLEDIADVIASAVRDATEPLRAESRALAEANAALAARVAELEAREVFIPLNGQNGRDGADCDMDAVMKRVDEQLAEAIAAIPVPEAGKDGADCDMEAVSVQIEQAVNSAVEAIPVPKDGEAGKDGLGLADALIDRDGALVLTMTDGTTKSLGLVVGKDGENGKDGHTFTLDDFDIEPLDERTVKMCFTHGGTKHSFELAIPAVIYRGVWREGETYQRGDVVTWGGSMWHCDKEDCTAKPDSGEWTLSVKKGRDGKDAK